MARDLLSESGSEDDSSEQSDTGGDLKINREFAQRFEHNKKREELQQLEDKHGKTKKRKRGDDDSGSDISEESSSSEDEDDAGELATVALDSQIMATLTAIKSRDPRVYDGTTTFYAPTNEDEASSSKVTKEKPMYLRDYHRENLLNGALEVDDNSPSYNEQQQQLKDEIVTAMHAAATASGSEDEEELLVAKERGKGKQYTITNVEDADKDPETFLSNFMVSRSWVPTSKSTYQPFESDDDEEDRRADEYEEAYNFRFEDPATANEKLRSHARDMAAKQSVRRQEMNARQKKREAEREEKDRAKQLRKEEKARLKRLRVDEVTEKIQKIKAAAGFASLKLQPEDWSRLANDEWDDARWEEEMQKRFDDEYYAAEDALPDGDHKSRRKPKFEDDIDITDIVPDFKEEEEADFSISDGDLPKKTGPKKAKSVMQKEAKKERRLIEQLVDNQIQMGLDDRFSKADGFRYRETSPQSFGLSAIDILLADDTQLNEFAGLKKLAAFRDPEKKVKDKRHLGKKARLRKWRQETFGDAEGVRPESLEPQHAESKSAGDELEVGLAQKKKRRRSKKQRPTETTS